MKIALILLFSLTSLWAGDFELHVIRKNKPVTVPNPDQLVSNVVALTESASVNVTDLYGTEKWKGSWEKALASDSFIHVVFTPPRKIRYDQKTATGWNDDPKPV